MKSAKIKSGLLLFAAIIAVIALALLFSGKLSFTALNNIDFVGFTFTQAELVPAACQSGGGSTSQQILNGALVLKSQSSGRTAGRYVETEVTGIDELLIIYEGSASAFCSGSGNTGSGIGALIRGEESDPYAQGWTAVQQSKSISTSSCPSSSDSKNAVFQPAVWKFRNNFDGSWSSLEGLGVGDVYFVKETKVINGNKQYLRISADSGGGCAASNGGSASITVYNIVRKENSFAVCKADEYLTTDETGRQICKSLASIVLNSEEAIKESFDEKLARVTAELEAKNAGLTADIAALQQQLSQQQSYNDAEIKQQLLLLQQELAKTKQTLANVEARDPNIINTIIIQEQLKPSNPITEFFNKIYAAIKNFFSSLFN